MTDQELLEKLLEQDRLRRMHGHQPLFKGCHECRKHDGKLVKRNITPILPGWIKDWGQPKGRWAYFHGPCYQTWYRGIYHEYAELDRSINECATFTRSSDDPTRGCCTIDGQRYWCRSFWNGEHMETAHPGLAGRDWWTPRRKP